MVQAARDAGFETTERLVTDWATLGLIEHPERQRGKQGQRGAVYLWSDNQKDLFVSLLEHRRQVQHVSEMAPIPVGTWLLWGEPWVELAQVRRVLVTWLGGHRKASSEDRATASARAVVNQFKQPGSNRADRKALREALAEANRSGEFDRENLVPLFRAVVDSDGSGARPLAFQLGGEDVADFFYALALAAARVDQLSDGYFIEARTRYRQFVLMYLQNWPALTASPQHGHLFEEPTLQVLFNRCCKDLLTFLGLMLVATERGVEPPPVLLLGWSGPPQQLIDSVRRGAPPNG
jgi:hypothetical protein